MRQDLRLPDHPRVEAAIELAVRAVRAAARLLTELRARRELHELNDRMLKDIGLNRTEIDSLFR
jgi:uncharacterized protein YjiS (DUF1127 family)